MSGSRDHNDLLLSLGTGDEASHLWVARERLQLHGVHRSSVLVRRLWRDQLSGGASALRDPLAARCALRARLFPLLVPTSSRRATPIWLLACGWCLGGPRGAS